LFYSFRQAGIAGALYGHSQSVASGAEWCGSIYLDQNGIYSFTAATDNSPKGCWIEHMDRVPSGTSLQGDWHSHGSFGVDLEQFSPGDDLKIDPRILTIPNYQGHFLGTPQGLVLFQNQLSVIAPPVVVYRPR
jgi:hypothetical protein